MQRDLSALRIALTFCAQVCTMKGRSSDVPLGVAGAPVAQHLSPCRLNFAFPSPPGNLPRPQSVPCASKATLDVFSWGSSAWDLRSISGSFPQLKVPAFDTTRSAATDI